MSEGSQEPADSIPTPTRPSYRTYLKAVLFIGVGSAVVVTTEVVEHLQDYKINWAGIGAVLWGFIELLGGKLEVFANRKIREERRAHKKMLESTTEGQTVLLMVAMGENLKQIREEMILAKEDTNRKHNENKRSFKSISDELARQDDLHKRSEERFVKNEQDIREVRVSQEELTNKFSNLDGKLTVLLTELGKQKQGEPHVEQGD